MRARNACAIEIETDRPRTLLADSTPLVGEGLCRLLAGQLDIVDAVADGRALLDAAERLLPDLVLLELSLPRLNGLDAASILTGVHKCA